MKNYLTITEVTKFIGSDHTRALADIKSNSESFAELNAVQACEYRMFYSIRDDKSLVYEYLYIYIIGTNVRLHRLAKNQYSFFNENLHNYHRVDNSERIKLAETLTQPNYIGVGKLTTKKVDQWLIYGQILEGLTSGKQKEFEDNEAEFRKSLEGQNVHYWSDKNRGSIERNGLTYEFEISRNAISTRIKLTAYKSDLESFLQLSDNKFTK